LLLGQPEHERVAVTARSDVANPTGGAALSHSVTAQFEVAKPGPLQSCTTSNGSVPSFTTTGVVDLMPSASYSCQVWQGGILVGELSWDNDPADKRLTFKGTIWSDGELVMAGTQRGTYVGEATIYFARKVDIGNSTELCATADCTNAGWDPNANVLALTIAASDVPAFEIQNFAKFQGAVYAVGGFKIRTTPRCTAP
jgi:hypothetical protein